MSSLSSLKKWINYQHQIARKSGLVFTYYGRPRNLQKYYNTSDPKRVALGDRSAVNSPVQGTGADVLKLKLISFDNLFKTNSEFRDNVKLAFTCYDEIDFYVRIPYLETAYNLITSLMYEHQPDWLVPLMVEGSVGYNWGDQISNPIFKDGKIVGSKDIKFY